MEELLPALGKCEMSRPVALVWGNRDKALTLARRYSIESRNVYS